MPVETITRSYSVLPVQVRTARKQHRCNDYKKPIEPGQKYEHSATPPHGRDFQPGCKAAATARGESIDDE